MKQPTQGVNALEEIEKAHKDNLDKMNGRSLKGGGRRLFGIVVAVVIGLAIIIFVGFFILNKKEASGIVKVSSKGLETVLKPEKPLSRTVGVSSPAIVKTPDFVTPDPKPTPALPPKTDKENERDKAGGDSSSAAEQESRQQAYAAEIKQRKLMAEDFGEVRESASSSSVGVSDEDEIFASENNSKGLAGKLNPVRLEMFRAGRLKNLDLVITQSAAIPCALTVAIDSTVPGFISCMVTEDVYGASGKVKLIDKFSKISGRQEGGMQQGQARIFAAWDRLETPDGVVIDLGSPATDEVGRSGVGGVVDNHWLARYGNAILLSVIQDGISAALQNTGGGGNNVNISTGSTANTMQDMAAEALKNSINIPPTLYKNQGELVYVMVARDLDFSGVYSLEYVE
ncbi:TPA: type IV secretion system protein VirB10 [Aeromonas veronii]